MYQATKNGCNSKFPEFMVHFGAACRFLSCIAGGAARDSRKPRYATEDFGNARVSSGHCTKTAIVIALLRECVVACVSPGGVPLPQSRAAARPTQDMTDAAPTSSAGFIEGALKLKRLTLAQAVMLLVGGNVGAAILSLPYAARVSGYPGAALVSVLTTVFSVVSHLYIVEIMLRTKRPVQLVGLMREHMQEGGHAAAWVALMALLTAGIAIPSLTAYVMGGAQIIDAFLPVGPVAAGLVFLIPGAAVVWLGLKATGVAQQWGSLLMGAALLTFALVSSARPEFDAARLARFVPGAMAAALPVGIFTSMSQALVPEVVRGLSHAPRQIPRAIMIGLAINLGFLLVFCAAIFGLQPFDAFSEVVTVSWGRAFGVPIWVAVNSFALLALLTSFWASALAAMGNVIEALGFRSEASFTSRLIAFAATVAPSVVLVFLQRYDFGDMISVAGAVGGVVLAVLPIPILLRARRRNERTPEFVCGPLFSPPVQVALVVFYVGALVYAALGSPH